MTTRRYASGSLMGILIGTSVAGVGLSFGRDVYKAGKQNLLFILLAVIALAGTAYGTWNMSRGHDRGPIGTFFLTFLFNALLICLSAAIFTIAIFAFGASRKGEPDNIVTLLAAVVISQAVFVLIGLAIGLSQRGRRKNAFAVAAANEAFLVNSGFRDVGGHEQVMLDPDGNELVLDDTRADAILFKVKGRRGVRARITLDPAGRMLAYVPA